MPCFELGREARREIRTKRLKARIIDLETSATEQRRGQHFLEAEEKLRTILASRIYGITVVGLDGMILGYNDSVLRLHGISRDEYMGKEC